MQIVLVDPETKANIDSPNIGLAYISAKLKNDEHIVIDSNILSYPKDRFLNYKCKWLGISVKLNTYNEAIRISKLYRDKYPGTKIVWGGAYISCAYEKLKKLHPDVDFYFGEYDFTENLDTLSFPDYTKFDSYNRLVELWNSNKSIYPIVTSRGCPYKCIYCASPVISGRKWRARSAEHCYAELELAKKQYGIKSFQILDDSFNIDKNRVLKFCELIKSLKLKWSCPNGLRANVFDEEMARAMADAGCYMVAFGIETVNPFLLKQIKKGETIEKIESAIYVAKKYFQFVQGYFIIGLPFSTYETDLQSLKWVVKKGIFAHFSYLVPFEGTELHDTDQEYRGNDYREALFFSKKAYPVSNAYSKKEQKKIYRLADCLRMGGFEQKLLIRFFNKLKLILLYDPKRLTYYMAIWFKNFFDRLKNLTLKKISERLIHGG